MSGGSFCCPVVLQPPRCYPGLPEAGVPEQDTEQWECQCQAELPSDGMSPGLTAHPKPGEMSLELAKVTRANSKPRPPLAAVPTEARSSHPAVLAYGGLLAVDSFLCRVLGRAELVEHK